jgi:hypothetical protein
MSSSNPPYRRTNVLFISLIIYDSHEKVNKNIASLIYILVYYIFIYMSSKFIPHCSHDHLSTIMQMPCHYTRYTCGVAAHYAYSGIKRPPRMIHHAGAALPSSYIKKVTFKT